MGYSWRIVANIVGGLLPKHFIIRSRGSTQRTASQPLGNQEYPSVQQGNIICARTLVILQIALAIGCWIILEQPVRFNNI